MAEIVIRADISDLAAMVDKLDKVGINGRQQLARGLNDAGNKARTDIRRALKRQMNTKRYGIIVSSTDTISAGAAGLAYVIKSGVKGLPIQEFPFRMSRSKRMMVRWSPREHWRLQKRTKSGRFGKLVEPKAKGRGVTAMSWGSAHAFQRSFADQHGNPVMARRGDGRGIRKLFGPSPAKELPQGESFAEFEASVPRHVQPIIAKRLASLL